MNFRAKNARSIIVYAVSKVKEDGDGILIKIGELP